MVRFLPAKHRFADYVLTSFKGGKTPSWSDVMRNYWLQSNGQSRKSFLPTKLVRKKWRGAAKKGKKGKANTAKAAFSVIRHNLDLNQLTLAKALGYLATFYTPEVSEVLEISKDGWKVCPSFADTVPLPTPSNRLLGPHLRDMLEALGLCSNQVAKERKWCLSRI